MAKLEDKFAAALKGKRIPVLTLDNKWHRLFTQAKPDKKILKLEEEQKELLKKQGKANTDIKEIKRLKKKLMESIVANADEAVSGKDKKAETIMEENKRLISECNEKIEECEEQLLELPRQIDEVNKELMQRTMEVCYDTLKKNRQEIDETAKWIAEIRIELKERLIKKQEQEQMNQELYSYMHDIFGADVIDIFDMEYMEEEK